MADRRRSAVANILQRFIVMKKFRSFRRKEPYQTISRHMKNRRQSACGQYNYLIFGEITIS